MKPQTVIDVIVVPKFLDEAGVRRLEDKLAELGEARIVRTLRLASGVADPIHTTFADGTQIELDRQLANPYQVLEFVRATYGEGYLLRGTVTDYNNSH